MVHGRTKDGRVDEFGVSGYVYQDTFLVFDRKTESLWYPLDESKWTAVSGPRKGETIPFIEKPGLISLGQWRKKHPNTVVLLGSKREIEAGQTKKGDSKKKRPAEPPGRPRKDPP